MGVWEETLWSLIEVRARRKAKLKGEAFFVKGDYLCNKKRYKNESSSAGRFKKRGKKMKKRKGAGDYVLGGKESWITSAAEKKGTVRQSFCADGRRKKERRTLRFEEQPAYFSFQRREKY